MPVETGWVPDKVDRGIPDTVSLVAVTRKKAYTI
jgi:hypothetical protein